MSEEFRPKTLQTGVKISPDLSRLLTALDEAMESATDNLRIMMVGEGETHEISIDRIRHMIESKDHAVVIGRMGKTHDFGKLVEQIKNGTVVMATSFEMSVEEIRRRMEYVDIERAIERLTDLGAEPQKVARCVEYYPLQSNECNPFERAQYNRSRKHGGRKFRK